MGIQEWLFVIVFPWLFYFAFRQSVTVVHILPAVFLSLAFDKASRPWWFLFFDPSGVSVWSWRGCSYPPSQSLKHCSRISNLIHEWQRTWTNLLNSAERLSLPSLISGSKTNEGDVFLARQHFSVDTITVRLKEMMEGGVLKVNVKGINMGRSNLTFLLCWVSSFHLETECKLSSQSFTKSSRHNLIWENKWSPFSWCDNIWVLAFFHFSSQYT